MIKSHQYDVLYGLVINRVTSEREGKTTADNIVLAAQRFLGVKVEPLGFVYDDPHVPKAVKKQVPFTIEYPHCAAAKGVGDIAERFLSGTPSDRPSGGMRGFLQRMTRMLLKDSENANRR
jgi:flagellar biosynthesis protein FlhG